MPNINITGKVQDAGGTGVDQVVTRLSPLAEDGQSAEAIGGIGLMLDPVEVLTNGAGEFTHPAVVGFRYRLEIAAIGYDRTFIAPISDVTFDLLGLVPAVSAARGDIREDADSDGEPDIKGDDEEVTFITIKVEPISTVRQRYDRVILERAATLTGVYSDVTSIDLLAGRTIYEFTDTEESGEAFYRAFYRQGPAGDISQLADVFSVEEEHSEDLLITVEDLKEIYLKGVDLTDDDGSEFSRRMLEHYIQAGADWLSKELDIPLTPVTILNETHDHYAKDYGRWGWFQLDLYPIIQVDVVRFRYPAQTNFVEIDEEWIVKTEDGDSGVIQIVPGQGNISDILLIPGALMPLWSGALGRVPGIWRFDYRAGFEAGSLPPDLKHVLGMWASIGVLNIAGDLIAGAGIATKSVSMPGLSQNIGTTSSATNSGYGARIIEYQKEIKEMLPNLRRYYGKATRMVVG